MEPMKLKICLVASAGGHLSQLLKIAEAWKGHRTYFITTSKTACTQLQQYGKVYVAGECNREHLLKVLVVKVVKVLDV